MRYRDDSPMPSRAQISDVDVLVSAYSRAISRFSPSLNLGRREPRLLMTPAARACAFAADTCARLRQLSIDSPFSSTVLGTSILRVALGGRRAQILAVLPCVRPVLDHYESIVDADPYQRFLQT